MSSFYHYNSATTNAAMRNLATSGTGTGLALERNNYQDNRPDLIQQPQQMAMEAVAKRNHQRSNSVFSSQREGPDSNKRNYINANYRRQPLQQSDDGPITNELGTINRAIKQREERRREREHRSGVDVGMADYSRGGKNSGGIKTPPPPPMQNAGSFSPVPQHNLRNEHHPMIASLRQQEIKQAKREAAKANAMGLGADTTTSAHGQGASPMNAHTPQPMMSVSSTPKAGKQSGFGGGGEARKSYPQAGSNSTFDVGHSGARASRAPATMNSPQQQQQQPGPLPPLVRVNERDTYIEQQANRFTDGFNPIVYRVNTDPPEKPRCRSYMPEYHKTESCIANPVSNDTSKTVPRRRTNSDEIATAVMKPNMRDALLDHAAKTFSEYPNPFVERAEQDYRTKPRNFTVPTKVSPSHQECTTSFDQIIRPLPYRPQLNDYNCSPVNVNRMRPEGYERYKDEVAASLSRKDGVPMDTSPVPQKTKLLNKEHQSEQTHAKVLGSKLGSYDPTRYEQKELGKRIHVTKRAELLGFGAPAGVSALADGGRSKTVNESARQMLPHEYKQFHWNEFRGGYPDPMSNQRDKTRVKKYPNMHDRIFDKQMDVHYYPKVSASEISSQKVQASRVLEKKHELDERAIADGFGGLGGENPHLYDPGRKKTIRPRKIGPVDDLDQPLHKKVLRHMLDSPRAREAIFGGPT